LAKLLYTKKKKKLKSLPTYTEHSSQLHYM